jgi:hypothetical protein
MKYLPSSITSVHHKGLISQAQYSIFFTTPNCPGGTCSGEFEYKLGDTAGICFGLQDPPSVGSEAIINCENIEGTFTLEIVSMTPHQGDANCDIDSAPFDVVFTSSDLPGDCVLTHFIPDADDDMCTDSCDN